MSVRSAGVAEEQIQVAYIKAVVVEQDAQAPPHPDTLFEDVYASLPWHLEEQKDELTKAIARGETP